MALGTIFLIIVGSAGLVIGLSTAFLLLKRGALNKNPDGEYSLAVPFFGIVASYSKPQHGGIFVDDVDDTKKRLGILKKYPGTGTMLAYAGEHRVNYVGLEGDRDDGSWTPAKLACYRPSGGSRGGTISS